jgi:hypothetical protein
MKIRSLVTLVVVTVASLSVRAYADTDPLSYDDPGMHYQAPAGWHRIPMPQDSSSPGLDAKRLLAVFTYTEGKTDTRLISIVADPFEDGGLDAAENGHESDLRGASSSTLITKKNKTTLTNGMPAWFLHATQGDDPFKSTDDYEYVVFDGWRRVVVSYTGRQFGFTEDDAKKALSTLYVVAYPKHRA